MDFEGLDSVFVLSMAVLLAPACSKEDAGTPGPAASSVTAAAAPTASPGSAKKATSAKKRVTGAPSGKSARPAGELPKLATKSHANLATNRESASETDVTCSAEEEGLAACSGDVAVFCAGGKVYALDCGLFVDGDVETATCGDLEGVIDCGWED